jgi:hypothetical protein
MVMRSCFRAVNFSQPVKVPDIPANSFPNFIVLGIKPEHDEVWEILAGISIERMPLQ